MKVYNIFIGSALILLGLFSYTFNKPVKIQCDSLEEIETIIKNKFNSDEAKIESKWFSFSNISLSRRNAKEIWTRPLKIFAIQINIYDNF